MSFINIAIIPARSGSRRIKNKNIRDVSGQPLIYWTMKAAEEAKCITKVLVSTENYEYIKIFEGLISLFDFKKTFIVPRKTEHATDKAQLEPFVADLLMKNKCNNVIILQPTSPVRLPGTIDEAYQLFKETKSDSLLTVGKVDRFIWKDGKPNYDPANRPRSQEYNSGMYYELGSIYITKCNTFIKNMNRIGENVIPYILKPEECFEIDSEFELAVCDAILKHIY